MSPRPLKKWQERLRITLLGRVAKQQVEPHDDCFVGIEISESAQRVVNSVMDPCVQTHSAEGLSKFASSGCCKRPMPMNPDITSPTFDDHRQDAHQGLQGRAGRQRYASEYRLGPSDINTVFNAQTV
ncbi:hypothetical protein CC2G_005207 [Coprinopsis cinerea AmutBmut pab1-1]|nr:hypothetical protein CC2G_005207 [Coprinopsis cinerea AmutBmut pab1-1]